MSTFTRATGPQERSHCLGNSTLTANYFAKVIRRNTQFQRKNIAVITNFANLYCFRIIH
jgi:hypothetical protein